jgi:phosphoribosylglycinamide formyltransferase-1
MKKIVIFASGSGSNAQRIAEEFAQTPDIQIDRIYCNKPDAFVLERAKNLSIPAFVFNRDDFYNNGNVFEQLLSDAPDLIVLAGFLWLIPENIIKKYDGRIINIHPALLPKYGGKGMYGMNVHKAVIANKEKESGITIHLVNEKYDDGDILFQASCNITEEDTPESLANKIHTLEYENFPRVIMTYLRDNL